MARSSSNGGATSAGVAMPTGRTRRRVALEDAAAETFDGGARAPAERRIVHLATDDETGGAARCARRLHQGLLRLGMESRMLVARRRSTDPTVLAVAPPADRAARIRRRIRRALIERAAKPYEHTRDRAVERFSDDRAVHGADLLRQLPPCDVVNLHWVAQLVDYRAFFAALPDSLPVVWTLHDMNVFTGGCHYADGCDRYQDQCGACPQLGSTRPLDLSWQVWRRKRDLFGQQEGRLHIVTPSRWLARTVEHSSVLGDRFPVSVIPYGIDTHVFAPRDRNAARDALGLPHTARIVLFAAHDVGNRRKGFALLAAALAGIAGSVELFLLTVGKGTPLLEASIPRRHCGQVSDDGLLSLIYSAADVFVVPSLQDNLPATILEALACGVPVVAFDAGGIPDAVRPGVTGALAPVGDAEALGETIVKMFENQNRLRELGANCRRIAVHEYGLQTQAQRYAELYSRVASPRGQVAEQAATHSALEAVRL